MSIKKSLLITSIIIGVTGYGIIWYKLGWAVCLAVLLIHYSINLERKSNEVNIQT